MSEAYVRESRPLTRRERVIYRNIPKFWRTRRLNSHLRREHIQAIGIKVGTLVTPNVVRLQCAVVRIEKDGNLRLKSVETGIVSPLKYSPFDVTLAP